MLPDVVTRAQALAAGLTTAEVDQRVRSGRWVALERAVYLTAPPLPEDPVHRHALLALAAVRATSVPCVVSHASAALLHGLPLFTAPPETPVLTRMAPTTGPRPPTTRLARLVADVPTGHLTLLGELPVTTVARTAVDLARCGGPEQAVLALDAGLRRVRRHELEEVLALQERWPGSVPARRWLRFADGRSESPLESLGRLRMAQVGLPAPELQVEVGGRRWRGRVDYLWAAHRTVAEADGRGKYASGQDLWDEKRREDGLRDDGFEVVRFSWDDALRRPHLLRDRVLRAFARAARTPPPSHLPADSDRWATG